MKVEDFKKLNGTPNLPNGWIGQGYGYKDERIWAEIAEDEVIYIPEYAYEYQEDGCCVITDLDDIYTKESFRDLVVNELGDIRDKEMIDSIACDLFYTVDWQYPESLINEGYLDSLKEEMAS